jgi:hypothetical protein
MRGAVFAWIPGQTYYAALARYVVYQTSDEANLELEQVHTEPSCDFDKSFGYPCSKEQQARVKQAADAGKLLPSY